MEAKLAIVMEILFRTLWASAGGIGFISISPDRDAVLVGVGAGAASPASFGKTGERAALSASVNSTRGTVILPKDSSNWTPVPSGLETSFTPK